MNKIYFALIVSFGLSSATAGTQVLMKTSAGEIKLELDDARSPVSVSNFLAYADSGFYDGTIFHRVIKGFMIQGGGLTKEMVEKPQNAPIKNEAGNGLKNIPYTIAMARTRKIDSATSQFFINLSNNFHLNHYSDDPRGFGYAVFGKVIAGTNVVNAIAETTVGRCQRYTNVPIRPIIIEKVERIQVKH